MTTALPDFVPYELPLSNAGTHEMNYSGRSLFHNGLQTNFPHLPSLHELSTHQTVGLLISTNGQLHMYIDGRHSECIASGVAVNKPVFGAVNVSWNCTKIKSEFLSGELIYTYMLMRVHYYHGDGL